MPAAPRKFLPSLLSIAVLLAIALPTVLALLLAHWLSMQRVSEAATQMARQTLARADMISAEMRQANRLFSRLAGQAPCGPESIRLMRAAMLHSDTLTDIGHIEGDRLTCSALGHQDLSVSAPSYTSKAGYIIRNDVRLRDAPGIKLVVATDPRTGYSMFAHATQIMDAIPAGEPWDVAVVANEPRAIELATRGKYDTAWLKRPRADGRSGIFVDKQHIIAWERSSVAEYTAYAAMPDSMWQPALRNSMVFGLALGVPASLLLLLLLRRMARRTTTIRHLLRQALKRDELTLAYQPIVDITSGRWVGAEALMRWNRPHGETISPDVFIPIAEKSGLMPALGEYLIRRIEREAPALFAHQPDFHIALNFCADDLCAEGFAARLQTAIQRTGGKPGSLQVEVTERAFLHLEHARPSIDELQKCGISVAIDDFGTGFSSLSYLTNLKFDCLKIDRSFVNTVNTGAVTSKIVDHIIAMSKSLGITVIAEGVETRDQADYLREQGVRYAQGWLYAKAMPIRELMERLGAQQVKNRDGGS